MKKSKITVIALGGSLIVPHLSDNGGIDILLLKALRRFILSELKEGQKFILVIGGGKTTRIYQKASLKIVKTPKEDLDWIGIHAIRLNAQLLRNIFRKVCYSVVIDHEMTEKEITALKKVKQHLLIASVWKPGRSSDFVAVSLAERFGSDDVVIAGDIPFVYDKDPKKFKGAKPLNSVSWKEYRKIIPKVWTPGLSSPVDPVAARLAEKSNITAKIIKGSDFNNFKKVVQGKAFKGTTIS